ncbi:STAS domain-containing protein [Mucilaginibacter aquatilis]|uniref:STAS domain-containing protein n=1 Tax=Mucilaginibacter aquatilis TaxID=1517760 RepID=A0A6I4I9Q5_9SPHI|nr:STAS domain-containing protein [Mucilaginibacter aquatilis]MVN90728.1 STAS domain-containing protein [Mucilaginibacter aquatilis]
MFNIVKEEPGHVLVQLNLTEANLSHADDFKDELITLLNLKKKSIWFDLGKVTYVDSSFLGALVAGLKHAIAMQCDVVLIALQKDIEDLLKLIRLDKVFKLYNNEQEAKASLL